MFQMKSLYVTEEYFIVTGNTVHHLVFCGQTGIEMKFLLSCLDSRYETQQKQKTELDNKRWLVHDLTITG
jgi:hypothetical protein